MDGDVYIHNASARLGVTSQYIRAQERRGRIPPARRDRFGDRVYSEFDLALLRALGVGSRPRRLKSVDEVLAAMR